jgi:hypothetical protein
VIKPQPTAPRTAWHLPTLAFLAITAWGCAAGGSPPTAQPQATLGPSIAATVPAATAAPAVTPVPAPSRAPALPAAPPEALLAGVDGAPVPGDLGGYTWNGAGSDAPWLVPPGTRAVRAPGPYAVRFGSDLAPAGWVLRWAPVKDGVVGDVAGWAEGAGAPVTASGPDEPGAWSLQADVRFADGHGAAWYWLVDTAP